MRFLIKKKIIRNVYLMTEVELGVVRLKIMKYKYTSDYLSNECSLCLCVTKRNYPSMYVPKCLSNLVLK